MDSPTPFSTPSPSLPEGKILLFEGNVASGKSTITTIFKEVLEKDGKKVILFPEYVAREKLMEYIGDMKTFGFSFQMHMQSVRIATYKKAVEYKDQGYVVIIDRGIVGDIVFAKLQVENGNMTPSQWDAYLEVFGKETLPFPDLVVYLKSDPKKCMERMFERNTDGGGYTLEYLEKLDKLHNDILKGIQGKVLETSFMEDIMSCTDKTTPIEKGDAFWKIVCCEI